MDTQRLFLFVIFSFSLVLVWDGWQKYQHPQEIAAQQVKTTEPTSAAEKTIADVKKNLVIEQGAQTPVNGKKITVKTDTLIAEINSVGGDIQKLSLLQHPDATDKSKPFVLFDKGAGTHNYFEQSGLLGDGLPNHNTLYEADQDHYELADGKESIDVTLSVASASGVSVIKTLTFKKASYEVLVNYKLQNTSNQKIDTAAYFQLIRDGEEPSGASKFVPTYTGAAVFTDMAKLQKIDFSSIDKAKAEYPKEAKDGWIGILQHYFVSAWIPSEGGQREYFSKKLESGLYSVGTIVPVTAEPGKATEVSAQLYAGPAQSSLDKVTPGLDLSVDYGWLTVIAKPMFWVMTLLNSWVHNWGVAIILLTILIKLIFFPLSAASYRSMAKMRVVAPKLENIKKQYANDREKLNRAMMDLYKTEKINPLGGCLPVLIQIPVFIALYWSILESVEMRYAPFFGWIQDLSAADPYYILPLIMGASMIVQSKLNPTPPDPMQAKLMQIMPVVFSVVFFFFPAGLVLYSVVNNILSIGQQWYITRGLEAQGLAVKN